VVFYVQDLAVANVPIQTAKVPHRVVHGYHSNVGFTIGGRDTTNHHYWDGLIGEVRLSSTALGRDDLLIENDSLLPWTIGHWKFEAEPSMLADSSGNNLVLRTADAKQSFSSDPRRAALFDFCHTLLNANEFIYAD
jgi:hypothetical protein